METEQTPRDIDVLKMFLKDIPGPYVEIGLRHGGSLKVARETTSQEVYGVDINIAQVDKSVKEMNVHLIEGDSVEVGKTWDKPIGALFIDGDHTKPYEDYQAWEKHIVQGGYLLMHDCRSAFTEVAKACDKIKAEDRWHILKEPFWNLRAEETSILVLRKK